MCLSIPYTQDGLPDLSVAPDPGAVLVGWDDRVGYRRRWVLVSGVEVVLMLRRCY
jgi:hypothetical protein